MPNGIDRNQSVRTPRLCAGYFTSIKMTSSKQWMANSSFIAKLISNRRRDGDIKSEGILQMPGDIPKFPLTGFRPILEITLQVATGFLMTLAAAFLLLQIEVNFGSPTSANLLF
jgi:hypothetical protein